MGFGSLGYLGSGGGNWTPPAPSAPANTVLPAIDNTAPAIGNTLTASPGYWSGYPFPSYAYQWKANGTNISGATASTYVVQAGDLGKVLTVTVTATNSQGSASATSAATSAVISAPVAPSISTVTISDTTPTVGDVLTATVSASGNPTPTIAYSWNGAGSPTNQQTYTVVQGDDGAALTVTATATNTAGSDIESSAPTSPVTNSVTPIHFLGDSMLDDGVNDPLVPQITALLAQSHTTSVDSGYGGTLAAHADRYDATPEYWDRALVVIDAMGPSDGDVTDIDQMNAALTSGQFLYVQALVYSDHINGTPGRTTIDGIQDDIATAYPAGYVETLTASTFYGSGSTQDEADIANGLWPSSLRADGVHPNAGGQEILAGMAAAGIVSQGWDGNRSPTNVKLPAIRSDGTTLTGFDGIWLCYPAGTVTRQWYKDGVAISGQTGSTYTLAGDESNNSFTFTVTYNGSVSATSPAFVVNSTGWETNPRYTDMVAFADFREGIYVLPTVTSGTEADILASRQEVSQATFFAQFTDDATNTPTFSTANGPTQLQIAAGDRFRLPAAIEAVFNLPAASILVQGQNVPLNYGRILGGDVNLPILYPITRTAWASNNGATDLVEAMGSGNFDGEFGLMLARDASGRSGCGNGGAVKTDAEGTGVHTTLWLGCSGNDAGWVERGEGFYDLVGVYARRVSDASIPGKAVTYANAVA